MAAVAKALEDILEIFKIESATKFVTWNRLELTFESYTCSSCENQMAAVVEALEDILDEHQLRALIDKGRSILSRARFVEVDILQKKVKKVSCRGMVLS